MVANNKLGEHGSPLWLERIHIGLWEFNLIKNKKGNTIGILGTIAILIVMLFVFGILGTASILNLGGGQLFGINKISSKSDSYRYQLTAVQEYAATWKNVAGDSASAEHKIDETITWYDGLDNLELKTLDVELPEDLKYRQPSITYDVIISGHAGNGGANPAGIYSPVPVSYKNLQAVCTPKNKDNIACKITGIAYTVSGERFTISGQPRVDIKVDLFKEGYDQILPSQETQIDIQGVQQFPTTSSSMQELNIFQKIWNWIKELFS